MCLVGFRYFSNVGARGSVVTWLETHDCIGYLHDILGHFCILKGGYHSLPFSLPDTKVFQYLTRHT